MPHRCTFFWKVVRIFTAEFFAAALATFPCFLIDPNDRLMSLMSSTVVGAAVYLGIWSTFPTSGGHINPMVTLAMLITRKLSPPLSLVYFIGQFCGTLASMGTAWAITPYREWASNIYGMTVPAEGCTLAVTISIEFITTFFFVVVVLASCDELRTESWQAASGAPFPFAVFLSIAVLGLVAAPISGGSMNPFRSIGAAIIRHNFDRQWVYFVGPPLGTVAACVFYELLLSAGASLRRTRLCLTSSSSDRKSPYSSESQG